MNNLDPVKIIDQESAKIFNVKADVFYLDKLFEDCLVILENPVPVNNDEGKVIGSAALDVVNKTIIADIFLDYSTPERFDIETGAVKWYPDLGGYVTGDPKLKKPIQFYIKNIMLSKTHVKDDRIKSLCF